MKQNRLWFLYSMIIVVAWGIWGAFIDYPAQQKPPFPETLGYVVWALTMIPPALFALRLIDWKLEHDTRSIFYGCVVGFLGAGGQLILFKTLRLAPAYLVFPFVALSPVVTIMMALAIARERATTKGWIGIALAVIAGVLLAYSPPESKAVQGVLWTFLAVLVLLAWGIQGFVISHANKHMKAESIFFYMMLTSVLLIPVALVMTDFTKEINWGFKGPYLAAMIQILNSIGALLLVYAFRYGKAIIVSPLTNAGPPVVTVVLSLFMTWLTLGKTMTWTAANTVNAVGIVAAVIATVLMAIEGEKG